MRNRWRGKAALPFWRLACNALIICPSISGLHKFAAIFDWDGVIIDSSRQHEQSWLMLAKEISRPLPPNFFLRSFGMKNERIIPELFGWTQDPAEIRQLSFRKESLYRQLIKDEGIQALPGVEPFLEQLRAAKVRCVVGSSTPRENIMCVIDVLGLGRFFEAFVCGEDVVHGKPNPEVFLLAAQKIETAPQDCVVFEDAHVGIEAALAGGMKVVALATTHPAESLSQADRVIDRLDQLSIDQLSALWS